MNKKPKRPTLKEVRARAAENAFSRASEILKQKWRPLAWRDAHFNVDPVAKALWECIEKIDKMCSAEAVIRRELEDKRR